MRSFKPQPIETNRFDGQPCQCFLCQHLRRSKAQRRQAVLTVVTALLGFSLLGLCVTLENDGQAIICGLAAMPLLFIAAMASLGVSDNGR